MAERDGEDVLALLLRRKARLLAFLARRLGNRADAEDLLQTALLKLVTKRATQRPSDRLVPWFYRVLRNLLADAYRARAARGRLRDRMAVQAVEAIEMDEKLFGEVCLCVNDVLKTLKREYAEVLRRIDMEDEPLRQAARALDISANNAGVRLHRARRALLKGLRLTCGICLEHGCLDCFCRKVAGRRVRTPG